MHYRTIGTTDLRVSTVALGCWQFAQDPLWGPQDDQVSVATIHAALDAGINFFDTAEGYGAGYSEQIVGKALAGRRDRAVVASKVSADHLATGDLRTACERSLHNLQMETIDLYQVHWPSRDIPMEETMETLATLRDEGKIRAIGVSNFGVEDLSELLGIGRPESNQVPYNLLWRAIEFEIQPLCAQHEISILTYSPLLHGLLTGKFRTADEAPDERTRSRHFSGKRPQARHGGPGFEAETFAALERIRTISGETGHTMAQVTLAWLQQRRGVAAVVVGARSPEQIERNLQAADIELPPDVIRALDAATDELKRKLGPGADPWESPSRIR